MKPKFDEILSSGETLATVLQLLKLPDGNCKRFLVEGK